MIFTKALQEMSKQGLTRFELDRPVPKKKDEKVIGLMKDGRRTNDEIVCWI